MLSPSFSPAALASASWNELRLALNRYLFQADPVSESAMAGSTIRILPYSSATGAIDSAPPDQEVPMAMSALSSASASVSMAFDSSGFIWSSLTITSILRPSSVMVPPVRYSSPSLKPRSVSRA